MCACAELALFAGNWTKFRGTTKILNTKSIVLCFRNTVILICDNIVMLKNGKDEVRFFGLWHSWGALFSSNISVCGTEYKVVSCAGYNKS